MSSSNDLEHIGQRLVGRTVVVEPLAQCHAGDLALAIGTPSLEDLWRFVPSDPYSPPQDFASFVAEKLAAGDAQWFAVTPVDVHQAKGLISLMREDKKHRVIEVGGIVFGPGLQRTIASTETQYLLADYVFSKLKYRRYEWKCDNRNAPSKRAAERLGFTFEGIFRQHMMIKGENRDTAWYSMLDNEWPARKSQFETWLRPNNFDATGRQIRPLRQA